MKRRFLICGRGIKNSEPVYYTQTFTVSSLFPWLCFLDEEEARNEIIKTQEFSTFITFSISRVTTAKVKK